MTNIKEYNFGPKEEFDLDNIEFESIDDFIVFLHKMEDLDVNITYRTKSDIDIKVFHFM